MITTLKYTKNDQFSKVDAQIPDFFYNLYRSYFKAYSFISG